MEETSSLWGPIEAAAWRDTPCTVGRQATADVEAGTAVFFIEGTAIAAELTLPFCALQQMNDGSRLPVIVIQAEQLPQGTVLGVRPLSGGNGICMLDEVLPLPGGFGDEHDL